MSNPSGPRKAGSGSSGSSSKPIGISSGINMQSDKTSNTNKSRLTSNMAHVSASAPVFSWQPPPPPAARPRVPSFDPPPLELPSSPPIQTPTQILVEEEEENNTNAQAIGTTNNNANLLKKSQQVYSRSLSNYSSSAPTHIDYLAKFQQITLNNDNPAQKQVGPPGISIHNTNPAQRKIDPGMSLGKSPTIFSILTQQVPEASEEEEETQQHKPVRGIVHSSRATTSTTRNDQKINENANDDSNDLQFDISLEEEEENASGGGGETNNNDSFY